MLRAYHQITAISLDGRGAVFNQVSLVALRILLDPQIAIGMDFGVGAHVTHRIAEHANIAAGGNLPGVCQRLAGQRSVLIRLYHAPWCHKQLFRADVKVGLTARGAVKGDFTVHVQRNVTLIGDKVFQVNPDPILIGHQADLVGVHATQRLGVHRQHWFCAFAGDRLDGAVFKTNAVGTLGQRQAVGVDLSIHFGGAADDVNIVGAITVQAFSTDGDCTLFHLQRFQRALLVELRFAGGQRNARRIDKSAAVAADAVGVGYHHVGLIAEHLELALQLGTAAAGDFIDDQLRGLAFEIAVGTQLPGQLRLTGGGGVVQHRAGRGDIEILIAVVRDAGTVWRGDINYRHVALLNLGIAVGGVDAGGEGRMQRLQCRQIDQQIAGAARQRVIKLIHSSLL
ncbi:hypothetical protein D3C81_685450 [compost metagenome]